jgi:hypothetical protein
MIRPPRLLSCVALACAIAVPSLYSPRLLAQQKAAEPMPADAAPADDAKDAKDAAPAPAEKPDAPAEKPDAAAPADAPATDAAPATEPAATQAAPQAPQENGVADMVDNYWHYALIARYDMSAAAGQRILAAGAKPSDVRDAFEQVARRRRLNVDDSLLRFQQIDPLRDVTTKIIQLINQGRSEQVMDPAFIEEQIKRLAAGERGYQNALRLLRQSGQYAVPFMIVHLRNPQEQELHGPIRRAMIDLGRSALSPLCTATESKDPTVLVPVITVLGEIGYDIAVPYLVRAATEPGAENQVRAAADRALERLHHDARGDNVADLFTDLSEKYYYDTAAITGDKRSDTSPVWRWDEAGGLTPVMVPTPIFNEVMSMRAAEQALSLGGGQADAASLWLAANNKREAELPQGAADPARGDRSPAHYYNVALGVDRLNNVLARALRDRNTPVALKSIRSLQGVAGQSNMFPGGSSGATPLTDALRFPDRLVRYEAAMAIAASLPQQQFNDQQRVVPLLAEAVAQSGRPNVLLVVRNEAERSRLQGELKNYATAGGVGATGALAEERSLPSVDVILVAADVPDEEIQRLVAEARGNQRLERTSKVIIRNHGGGMWPREALSDNTISVIRVNAGPALADAIETARARAGGLPLDANVAGEFALRAAQLLSRLAISRGQVLDLSPALNSLLGSLSDPRPEIAKAVGDTVALIESPQVQPALLDRSQDTQVPEDVRSSMYRSLATSAKFYGNQLNAGQINALRQTVQSEGNQDVRSAAAEALGALNAPVQNVAQLITQGPQAPVAAAGAEQPVAQPAQTEPAPAAPADAAPAPEQGTEPAKEGAQEPAPEGNGAAQQAGAKTGAAAPKARAGITAPDAQRAPRTPRLPANNSGKAR